MVPLSFAGEEWLLTEGRALYWPRERALLVADLHLEKASWYAGGGQLLPPYDSRETLERSNDYARRGIERFPDHWRFYFDIGFNYYIEWKHRDEEERQAMEEKALPYFSVAASLPGSRLDPNFVTELYLQRNEVSMALFHAYLRYWESSDRERASLRGRITRYQSDAAATRLEGIEQRWKTDYGYMPFGLFEALGQEHEGLPPSDWTQPRLETERGG